jgi:osmotically-inducible protein OsmY
MRRLRFAAIGAALAYFFDPDNGRRRRKAAIKRLAGLAQKLPSKGAAQPGDEQLARNVETEIFSDADVPKDKINVDAENGKVVLRGEAESPAMIDELVSKARGVQGVEDVESLLQVAGQ